MIVKAGLTLGIFLLGAWQGASAGERHDKIGAWDYWELSDPMTDKKRYGVSIDSADRKGTFIAKCDSPGGVYLQVWTKEYLGEGRNNGKRVLEYRVDQSPVVKSSWHYDKRSAFQFDYQDASKIINLLKPAKRLVVRAYTYEFESVTVEFNLQQSSTALTRVVNDCNGQPNS